MAKKKEKVEAPVDMASEALALAKANEKAIQELREQLEKAVKALDGQHRTLVERNRLR